MKLKRLIRTSVLPFLLFTLAAAFTTTLHAQTRVVGTVTDDDGLPVAGVTVMLKGTLTGTQTDQNGRYIIETRDAKDVIQFSCLGYQNVEERVGSKAIINVSLLEDREALDEVVVVGYGTQKKVNLTGSVTALSMDEIGESRTILSPSAALAGLVPGMNVAQSTGLPGSESATITIRGYGTFSSGGSSPLVLVDGLEWDMDHLNPNDIESISVLKDAASTAIYGSRAANGVILVTTKSGEAGKPKISYSFKGVWQRPVNEFEVVSNSADYMEFVNESCDNANQTHSYAQATIDLFREKEKDPYGLTEYGIPNYKAYPNTNWFKEIFNTGFTQEHNISVSGGGNTVRYAVSGSYLDNTGVITSHDVNSSAQKATFRSSIDADVTKWFSVGAKIFATFSNTGTANIETAFYDTLASVPYRYPGDNGKYGTDSVQGVKSGVNFFRDANTTAGTHYVWNINASAYVKIRPYKGLSIEATVGYAPKFALDHTYSLENQGSWDYVNNTQHTSNITLDSASVADKTSRSYYANTEILARYDTVIKHDHELGVLLGYSTEVRESWTYSVHKKGATDWSLNDGSTYSDLQSANNTPRSGWAMRSYFARVNYVLKDRYLFEANVRMDGSSVFGANNRYGTFPSFSAGWKIHEEPWMESAESWLSQLKLRASVGETGNNQGIGNYSAQATYQAGNVVIDGANSTGLYIDGMSNVDLKWETTTTTDIGLDLGFFDNRLTAELDYYYKATRDLLYTPSTYMTMGNFSQVPANLGNLWNQGLEIALNWKDTVGDGFYYYIGANFSFNRNKVTKFKGQLVYGWDENGVFYANAADTVESWANPHVGEHGVNYDTGKIVEGYSLGEHCVWKLYRGTGAGYSGGEVDLNAGPKDGIIRTEADMAWVRAMVDAGYTFQGGNTISKSQLWYGDFVYADLDGDGNYGSYYDRYFTGRSSFPIYNLGITLGFAWKGLEFSMVWSGAFDFDLTWNYTYYNTPTVSAGFAIGKEMAYNHYFYDPDNPDDARTNIYGKHPRFYTSDKNRENSDYYEYRADYMKLKNVTIAYTLPKKITRKAYINQLKFFVTGENLFTITSYPGQDPELGTDMTYPLMRQYTLGAQITF